MEAAVWFNDEARGFQRNSDTRAYHSNISGIHNAPKVISKSERKSIDHL